jgi:hypothetical protein
MKNNKVLKLVAYADPGHAWVKIKRETLISLNIEDKISRFSYQRGDYCYLEEDCDVTILVEALKAKGIEYQFSSKHTDKRSKIRSYYPYQSITKTHQESALINN